MKLQESNTQVLTGGLTSPVKQFTINATAKAFSILSSGLYTDKIKAILRELSCNAYDAHVAKGNADQPFEVHLPNSFEPFLRISDFGPGLSEDDVYNLYTTYFQSSKTDSNDYIGALGLGSKSPFSYTQSFTVTSRFDGKRKVYSAFLTEEGLPSIVKMSEEPWNGATGLDVQLSIKSNDFYTFQAKASEVFTYFPVTPKFLGARVEVQKPEYSTKGTGWAIRKSGYGDSGARAIQGVVAYPVPQTNDKEADELLRLGVDLIFEIGELEVAASREALSMNKATSKNLADRIKLMAKEIGSEITKSIEAAPTYWDAVAMYSDLIKNNSVRYAIKNVEIKWQGRKMIEYFDIKPDEYSTLRLYACERRGYGRGLVKEASANYVTPKEHILVRNDLKRGSKGVLNRWMKQFAAPGQKYYLVSPGWNLEEGYDANPDIDNFFINVLGNPSEIKSLEAMKLELPKTVRTVGARSIRNVFQVFTGSGHRWCDVWNEASDDDMDAEVFYYIPSYRNQPHIDETHPNNRIDSIHSLKTFHASLVRLGLIDKEDPIFNGSTRMMAELAKLDAEEREKWVNVLDIAVQATTMTKDEKDEIEKSAGIDLYNAGFRQPNTKDTLYDVLTRLGITSTNETIPAIAEIKAAYTRHFEATPLESKYQIKSELSRLIGNNSDYVIPRPKQVSKPNLNSIIKSFGLISNGFSAYGDWNHMAQAIKLIEAVTTAKMV